jgi:uncharacterized protein YdhG (YjbR/CyaY superfamily)
MEANPKFKTVTEYFSSLTPAKRKVLKHMQKAIKEAAPEAEELISYNIPALKLHGMLVFYAAWKEHVALYGVSKTIADVFEKELKPYKQSKGTIQFPLHEPLPLSLITKIVKHRVKENIEKAALKNKKSV